MIELFRDASITSGEYRSSSLLFVCFLSELCGVLDSEMGRRKALNSVHEHEMFSAAGVIILLCFLARLQAGLRDRSTLLDQALRSTVIDSAMF